MDRLERIVMENKISLARTISIIGTLILCIALVGNSFEVLSVTAFRIIIAFGILSFFGSNQAKIITDEQSVLRYVLDKIDLID